MKEKNILIDTHCHLNLLESITISEAIINAENNSVKIINNICTNVNEAEKIIEITKKYDNVFCSMGHHPEEVENSEINLEDILKYKLKVEKLFDYKLSHFRKLV